jgi:hypothetical protein
MRSAPHRSIPEGPEALAILFRIVSRDSWGMLQAWHESIPGSRIEHLMFGCYVLHVPPGGAGRMAA